MFEIGTKIKVIDGEVAEVPKGSIGTIIRLDPRDDVLPYEVEFNGKIKWMREDEVAAIYPPADTYYIAWTGTNIPAKTVEAGREILEAIRHTDPTATLHQVSDTIVS